MNARTLNFADMEVWNVAEIEGWKVADTILSRDGNLPTIFLRVEKLLTKPVGTKLPL